MPCTDSSNRLVRVLSMAHCAAVAKAVVPVAGRGARSLPATKATPKVMLPVVDKPAIQYVVEEAVSAGLTDVLLITGDNQDSISDHFDRAHDLEAQLAARGNHRALADVRAPTELASVSYVRQESPLGLGHAVLCAAEHVGDEPFAVLLGDDLINLNEDLLARMIAARQRYGGSIVALMEVPPEQVSAYGGGDRPDREAGSERGTVELDRDRPLYLRSGHFRRAARDPAWPQRRDPAHRRAANPGDRRPGSLLGRRRGARRAVPRPPLRHRQQARLPADYGRVRLRQARPGRRVHTLASRVHYHAGVKGRRIRPWLTHRIRP